MVNSMNKLLLLAILCIWVSVMGTEPVLLSSYPTRAKLMAVDGMGSFYSASDSRLSKYDHDGKWLVQYEEFKYGKITAIDVSNPLKIVIWYGDFMTAIVTDRFLSPVASYNFFDLGYQNIGAVTSSSDGQLWCYDLNDTRIKKIDPTGRISTQSQPLRGLVREAITPSSILERNGKLYLCDPAVGILIFDNFGAYSRTIPVMGVKQVQVYQDQLIYSLAGKLEAYNPITLAAKTLTLPDTVDVLQSVIDKERIAILKSDRIDFYTY
jgi:hypothetical protein